MKTFTDSARKARVAEHLQEQPKERLLMLYIACRYVHIYICTYVYIHVHTHIYIYEYHLYTIYCHSSQGFGFYHQEEEDAGLSKSAGGENTHTHNIGSERVYIWLVVRLLKCSVAPGGVTSALECQACLSFYFGRLVLVPCVLRCARGARDQLHTCCLLSRSLSPGARASILAAVPLVGLAVTSHVLKRCSGRSRGLTRYACMRRAAA